FSLTVNRFHYYPFFIRSHISPWNPYFYCSLFDGSFGQPDWRRSVNNPDDTVLVGLNLETDGHIIIRFIVQSILVQVDNRISFYFVISARYMQEFHFHIVAVKQKQIDTQYHSNQSDGISQHPTGKFEFLARNNVLFRSVTDKPFR